MSTICMGGEPGIGFEISFTEYVREISIISMPSHRRRDSKSKITPLELSQLRALIGQLLWLGMQCVPQLLAPLSLLMGQTPQASVHDFFEMKRYGANTPLKIHTHHSSVVSRTQMLDGPPDDLEHATRSTAGLHRIRRAVAKKITKHVSHILALESSETCGEIVFYSRNSSSSRQTAMTKLSAYDCV